MGKYDDIINLPHHVSLFHRPMSMENRAAQFAPFAALSGHDDAISETARYTEFRIELADNELAILNKRLSVAHENRIPVNLVVFHKDPIKAGGYYLPNYGIISKVDEYTHTVQMETGETIRIHDIYTIESKEFDDLGI